MKILQQKLQERLVSKTGGRELSCAEALSIAQENGVSPVEVGRAAQRLGIKIKNCQLGCFGILKEI